MKTEPKREKVYYPVMEDIPVDKEEARATGRFREFKNKEYYFCCDPCVTEFDMSPEQYAT